MCSLSRIIGFLAGAVILLALTAESSNSCANNAGSQASTSVSSNAHPTDKAKLALPANQAQIGDLLLTVNGVQQSYTDTLFPAESGTHYVAVDVSAQNTGQKTYSLNVLNFRLRDSAGYANEHALTDGPKPQLGAHDLVPGQQVRGYLVFKVGDGRAPTELHYQSFTGTPGIVKLGQ